MAFFNCSNARVAFWSHLNPFCGSRLERGWGLWLTCRDDVVLDRITVLMKRWIWASYTFNSFIIPKKGNSITQRVIPHHRIYKKSSYETTAHGRLQRMKNNLRNLPYSRLSDDIEDNFKCIQYTKRPSICISLTVSARGSLLLVIQLGPILPHPLPSIN